jgi:hypothetical protein
MKFPQAALFFFLVVLGFEFMVSHLLGRCSYHLRHSASPVFVLGIFEKGSRGLFAQADFEP